MRRYSWTDRAVTRTALAVISLAIVSAAAEVRASPPRAKVSADDEIVGKWTAIEHYFDGKPWPGRCSGFWVFQDGKAYSPHLVGGPFDKNERYNPRAVTVYDRYRVNRHRKPWGIDLFVHSPNHRNHSEGQLWKGVYEIREDKLILCDKGQIELFGQKERDGKLYDESIRPTAISSADHVDLWVFKRVEPGSAEDIWSPSDMEEQTSKYEDVKETTKTDDASKSRSLTVSYSGQSCAGPIGGKMESDRSSKLGPRQRSGKRQYLVLQERWPCRWVGSGGMHSQLRKMQNSTHIAGRTIVSRTHGNEIFG